MQKMPLSIIKSFILKRGLRNYLKRFFWLAKGGVRSKPRVVCKNEPEAKRKKRWKIAQIISQFPLKEESFSIRPIAKEDMEQVRQWRNAQMDILRQTRFLSRKDQEMYWEKVLAPSFSDPHPTQVLFGFLEEEKLIGYGGMTHIDWREREGEVSFLLNPIFIEKQHRYRLRFGYFLKLVKRAAFDKFKLKRLFTETYDVRPVHIAELESHGFQLEKRLPKAVLVKGEWVDSLIHGCDNER